MARIIKKCDDGSFTVKDWFCDGIELCDFNGDINVVISRLEKIRDNFAPNHKKVIIEVTNDRDGCYVEIYGIRDATQDEISDPSNLIM